MAALIAFSPDAPTARITAEPPVRYGPRHYPYNSSDSLPALLIAAGNYILATGDWEWAKA